MPTECRPKARMPGSTPMPKARTNSTAKTRSGMARHSVMMPRAARYTTGCGVVLAAARKAKGMESTVASTVPSKAIIRVSSSSSKIRGGSLSSGGSIRPSRLATSPKPPPSVRRSKSMYAELSTVKGISAARITQRMIFSRGALGSKVPLPGPGSRNRRRFFRCGFGEHHELAACVPGSNCW